ncbi:MAG TPA: BatA domain-containing protein [bacterium]|nr:BatA domain-containing protein [bacterium]
MISFLNPLYLLLLPLAALPFLLNLVKRRVRLRLRFPSVQLLKTVEERRARRRPRWYEILLLAVRVAVILLLVFTVAGPRFTAGGSAPPRALIVVVDNSPSMTYVEDGETRAARAGRYARSLAAGAGPDDLGAVLWTGGPADVVWENLRDAATTISPPPAAGGNVADALAAAKSLWAAPDARGRRPELAVITDMQLSAFEDVDAVASAMPRDAYVTFYDVRSEPTPSWNVALAGFGVTPGAGEFFNVNVEVSQYGRPRPASLEAGGVVVGDVPAAARATARVPFSEGGRHELSCRGGYPFDDRVDVFVPEAAGVACEVAPATPGARSWRAALAAAGCEEAAAPASLPGIYVMPLSAWRGSSRGRALAEGGTVVVVVPDDAGGGRFDDVTTLSPLELVPARVSADGGVLPYAASAGTFEAAGVAALETTAPWLAAAATSPGLPFAVTRRMGKGEVFLICTPTVPRYTDLLTSPAFVGFALDLRLRALARANPAFAPARAFASPESDPRTIGEEGLRRLFPHVVVTRHAPAGRGRASVPLQAPLAAAALLLLTAEALLASGGVRVRGGPPAGSIKAGAEAGGV